jgi:hypothetical protein
VKKKALGYIKAWAKQFEDLRDPNLGIMGELYDQLRAKSEVQAYLEYVVKLADQLVRPDFAFDEPERAPETQVSVKLGVRVVPLI